MWIKRSAITDVSHTKIKASRATSVSKPTAMWVSNRETVFHSLINEDNPKAIRTSFVQFTDA